MSGLNFWENFEITLRLETEFELGDGKFYNEKTIQFIWLDINPEIKLVGPNKPTFSQRNIWELIINRVPESKIFIEWRMEPEIDGAFLTNSNDKY